MAFDTTRQRVVSFGGFGSASLDDPWEWDGTNWSEALPTTRPGPSYAPGIAWDGVRQRIVLVTGTGTGPGPTETWEWDGTTWVLRMPAVSPPPRPEHQVAWDAARQRLVHYGGASTWLWDGTTWALHPQTPPPVRPKPTMAYDADQQQVVLFGGSFMTDMWSWNGASWLQRTPVTSPPQRLSQVMAYDATRRRLTLYDGMNTWRLPALKLQAGSEGAPSAAGARSSRLESRAPAG